MTWFITIDFQLALENAIWKVQENIQSGTKWNTSASGMW
jgi:hypothetical protein